MIADLGAAGEDLLLAYVGPHREAMVAIADRAAPVEREFVDALRRISTRRPHVDGDDAGGHDDSVDRAATASSYNRPAR